MEENENTFKSVNNGSEKKHGGLKTVIISFISGIVGAALVIGICFGIPGIREKILNVEGTTSRLIYAGSYYKKCSTK